jgi:excisionase family DNA binding protein
MIMSKATQETVVCVPGPRRWLSAREAADYSTLSLPAVRKLLRERRLKAYRPSSAGRRVVIDREELDALILASAATA